MSSNLKWKWWFAIVVGFCSIIDGILMIISLGWLQSKLATKLTIYGVNNRIYRKR